MGRLKPNAVWRRRLDARADHVLSQIPAALQGAQAHTRAILRERDNLHARGLERERFVAARARAHQAAGSPPGWPDVDFSQEEAQEKQAMRASIDGLAQIALDTAWLTEAAREIAAWRGMSSEGVGHRTLQLYQAKLDVAEAHIRRYTALPHITFGALNVGISEPLDLAALNGQTRMAGRGLTPAPCRGNTARHARREYHRHHR